MGILDRILGLPSSLEELNNSVELCRASINSLEEQISEAQRQRDANALDAELGDEEAIRRVESAEDRIPDLTRRLDRARLAERAASQKVQAEKDRLAEEKRLMKEEELAFLDRDAMRKASEVQQALLDLNQQLGDYCTLKIKLRSLFLELHDTSPDDRYSPAFDRNSVYHEEGFPLRLSMYATAIGLLHKFGREMEDLPNIRPGFSWPNSFVELENGALKHYRNVVRESLRVAEYPKDDDR